MRVCVREREGERERERWGGGGKEGISAKHSQCCILLSKTNRRKTVRKRLKSLKNIGNSHPAKSDGSTMYNSSVLKVTDVWCPQSNEVFVGSFYPSFCKPMIYHCRTCRGLNAVDELGHLEASICNEAEH